MRAFALILALLLALPAAAQDWRPITTQHGYVVANAQGTTTAMSAGVGAVRLTCTAACYYAFGVSNGTSFSNLRATLAATNSSTHFLPANIPVRHLIGEGEFILFIQVSSAGEFHVTEMSK